MNNMTLSRRLVLAFTALLLASCFISGFLQVRSANEYSQGVIQRLSANLAAQIASNNPLLSEDGLNQASVHSLFGQLMSVNPSVEVYLLDQEGNIISSAAPAGKIQQKTVDLRPIQALLAGAQMPVYGDNPRDPKTRQVFSVAPLKMGDRVKGYVYIVLLGEHYTMLSSQAQYLSAIGITLRSMVLVIIFGTLAGILAFRWVTKPMRQLAAQIATLDKGGMGAIQALAQSTPPADAPRDEIALIQQAFVSLAQRIDQQWQSLKTQDRLRREFIANISHDLRTPLTSLQGYLETLSVKSLSLSETERQRFLDIALHQSRKVSRLAQELFELARLEYGVVKPKKEAFSLGELVQDVLAKFALTAEARQQRLVAALQPGLPLVYADLGMIERVLTNLLDNAVRHTPKNGQIDIRLSTRQDEVIVRLQDSGPGIADELKESLFVRPSVLSQQRYRPGGLGLMIVQRILLLHDSVVSLVDAPEGGACFEFALTALSQKKSVPTSLER